MKLFSDLIKTTGIAILFTLAIPVFAEPAPVYDADSLPQQFDNSDQNQQDLPPPPAPQEEGAYVPKQQLGDTGPNISARENMSRENLSADQRLNRVEQQVNNMQNSEDSARVDSLQNQVQSLRSQVEQLTHQLQQVQNQQKNTAEENKRVATQQRTAKPAAQAVADNSADNTADNADENAQMQKPVAAKPAKVVEPKTVAEASQPSKPAVNQPNVAEEQQIYQTAYDFIKAKKYPDAVNALQKMLQKYPSGQFAANAHYWLGELYGLMGKNDQAMTEFSTVVKSFSDSPRVSDAQLKVGLIYASESKWSDAKTIFKTVINHYPGTASARLASEQLKQIKQAGH